MTIASNSSQLAKGLGQKFIKSASYPRPIKHANHGVCSQPPPIPNTTHQRHTPPTPALTHVNAAPRHVL